MQEIDGGLPFRYFDQEDGLRERHATTDAHSRSAGTLSVFLL